MSPKSINQFIIDNIVTPSTDLKSFHYGENIDYDLREDITYPNLFLERPFNLQFGNNVDTITFTLYVSDQVSLEASIEEEDDAIDSMYLIAMEVIGYLRNYKRVNPKSTISFQVSDAFSYVEKSTNNTAGWGFQVSLSDKSDLAC